MDLQRHLGHLWNQPADRETIGADGQVLVRQHVFQFQAVHDREGPLQQGLRYFESDEIVVLLRRIAVFRHLRHVEPELGFQMRGLVLGIADGLAKPRAQLRILDGHRLVDRRVAGDVRRVVRQSAQGEGVLVNILTLAQQLEHEVAAADVVHQIAELRAAEG